MQRAFSFRQTQSLCVPVTITESILLPAAMTMKDTKKKPQKTKDPWQRDVKNKKKILNYNRKKRKIKKQMGKVHERAFWRLRRKHYIMKTSFAGPLILND